MLYTLVFTVFAVTLLVSGKPNGGLGRITGGTLASNTEQFPFVVSISEQNQHVCGGFIYNDRWVVTSASCVHGKSSAQFRVTVGSLSDLSPDLEEQIFTIYNIVEFSQFDPVSLKHDITLIELSRPISFGTSALPIRYDDINELATPWDAYFVGWGATFEGGPYSTRLRWAPIDDLSADCSIYGLDEVEQTSTICAGSTTGTISPCQYDEGSPLVQKINNSGIPQEIVVGIMSRNNNGCANPSVPTIYTRLATYASWLLHFGGPQQ